MPFNCNRSNPTSAKHPNKVTKVPYARSYELLGFDVVRYRLKPIDFRFGAARQLDNPMLF